MSSGIVVYLDNDGDGRGNVSTKENVLIDGYVTLDGDCQDNDANLNPFDQTETGNQFVGDCS